MQYNVENSNIAVALTAVNFDVAVFSSAPIEVAVGEAARIDVGAAVNYIKSGKAEIDEAVRCAKNTFNENATAKTDNFNANAIDKTSDFNNNYTAKKTLIDAEVITASGYAASARQWAIGDPTEPSGNSAKYWANEAQTTSASKANVDLSNLSAAGEAKFSAKQDVISDLAAIRSGAALGETAVQLADLAIVATTGNYSDLSNTPSIPTVNDATLIITQNGTTKGTFTANASSNVTIALDGGSVDSVNGYTGIVVLSAGDVGIMEYTANEVETLWESL